MISSCDGKIITICENYVSGKTRMDISSMHQASFVCTLYVATSMCQLCVQPTYFVCIACACT